MYISYYGPDGNFFNPSKIDCYLIGGTNTTYEQLALRRLTGFEYGAGELRAFLYSTWSWILFFMMLLSGIVCLSVFDSNPNPKISAYTAVACGATAVLAGIAFRHRLRALNKAATSIESRLTAISSPGLSMLKEACQAMDMTGTDDNDLFRDLLDKHSYSVDTFLSDNAILIDLIERAEAYQQENGIDPEDDTKLNQLKAELRANAVEVVTPVKHIVEEAQRQIAATTAAASAVEEKRESDRRQSASTQWHTEADLYLGTTRRLS